MITDVYFARGISNAVIAMLLGSGLLCGCSNLHSVNKLSNQVAAGTVNAAACDANQTITTLEINGEQKIKIVSSGPINLVLGNNEIGQATKSEISTLETKSVQNSDSSHSITFLSSTAKLTLENKKRIVEFLPQAYQAKVIFVKGRTDGSGDKASNRKLAIARAVNVKNELILSGIDPKKIKTMYCTRCYLEPNDTPKGRSVNRRVDIQFYNSN
jgi:outer membrane protein OmpA-like peptidoglycan-associated protein